jgi:hypothetical protein
MKTSLCQINKDEVVTNVLTRNKCSLRRRQPECIYSCYIVRMRTSITALNEAAGHWGSCCT